MFPLNLPNVLTLLRILLVPVLVVALTERDRPTARRSRRSVFAVAALTDGLDGYIARSRQSITTFGKVMDPVADKLLIAAALISLVSLDRVAAWVAMVIIAREFAVSGLRIAAGQQGVVIPASGLGKIKTIVQSAAVLALIAAPDSGRRVGPGARLRDGRWRRSSRAPTTSSTSAAGSRRLAQRATARRRAARRPSALAAAARRSCEPLEQLLAASRRACTARGRTSVP